MLIIIIIFLEFLWIYFLSRQIFTLLYTLFYLPLKHLPRRLAGHNISNSIVSLLFLPGTAIHEFSHAFIARLLGVKTGEIFLYPHKDKETGEFKAGSIEIEHVDPVRLSLIGIAPSLIGLIILTFAVLYMFEFSLPLGELLSVPGTLLEPKNYLLFLLLFIVSMTMFTSRRDLKEFLIVSPALAIIFALLYFAGFRISLSGPILSEVQKLLTSLAFVLGVTLVVDLVVYIFLFIPISLILSLLGKRLK